MLDANGGGGACLTMALTPAPCPTCTCGLCGDGTVRGQERCGATDLDAGAGPTPHRTCARVALWLVGLGEDNVLA